MRLKPMVPPGGYTYPVGETILDAPTEEMLYDKVVAYKVQNRLIPTDREAVIREINDFICSRHPRFCSPDPGEFARQTTGLSMEKQTNIIMDRALGWIDFWMKRLDDKPMRQFSVVPKEVAEKRASACLNCPANKLGMTNCPKCTQEIYRQSLSAVANRSVTITDQLGVCDTYGHDNKAAIWLSGGDLKASELDPAHIPSICWKKELV